MRARTAGVIVTVAAVTMSGCSQNCAAIGADSGVLVDLGQRGSREMTRVEARVAGTCTSAGPRREHTLWAPLATLSSTDPVQVQVTVDGVPVLDRTVEPQKTQPNGPSCPPVAYQAKVSLPAAQGG